MNIHYYVKVKYFEHSPGWLFKFIYVYCLFECHISNTIKYTNIQRNKTYLIPSPFGLTRHYRFKHDINTAYHNI